MNLEKQDNDVVEEVGAIRENVTETQGEVVEGAAPAGGDSTPKKELTPQQKNAKWIILGVVALMACAGFTYSIGESSIVDATVVEEKLALDEEYQKLMAELDNTKNLLVATNADIAKNLELYDKVNLFYEEKEANEAKLETLKAEVAASEAKLERLTGDITKASGKPVKLPAGEFRVGEDIEAGRYSVTGSSNFFVYDSAGRLKVNIILGGGYGVPSYVCSLSTGDSVRCGGSDTFTPIN